MIAPDGCLGCEDRLKAVPLSSRSSRFRWVFTMLYHGFIMVYHGFSRDLPCLRRCEGGEQPPEAGLATSVTEEEGSEYGLKRSGLSMARQAMNRSILMGF